MINKSHSVSEIGLLEVKNKNISISFENELLIYNSIPLSLYGILGLFKMTNYAYNPSVWASGLKETNVEFGIHYTIDLTYDNKLYSFTKEDLFVIRDWLKINNKEWYESLPNITSEIIELMN
jgi:hypothetical protein